MKILPNVGINPIAHVGISPQNFLTFIFSPKLINMNQEHLSKKAVFLVKSLQNWGCATSLIEMLELLKFEHIYKIIWVAWSNFVGDVIK